MLENPYAHNPDAASINAPTQGFVSNLGPGDMVRRSATAELPPPGAPAHAGGEADRRVEMHRLQGLPIGLHRMERHRSRRSRRTAASI